MRPSILARSEPRKAHCVEGCWSYTASSAPSWSRALLFGAVWWKFSQTSKSVCAGIQQQKGDYPGHDLWQDPDNAHTSMTKITSIVCLNGTVSAATIYTKRDVRWSSCVTAIVFDNLDVFKTFDAVTCCRLFSLKLKHPRHVGYFAVDMIGDKPLSISVIWNVLPIDCQRQRLFDHPSARS